MKKVAILFIVLLTSSFLFSQNTYVPDDKFEQALIDLGYDTTLDDSVVTANISGVPILDVSSKSISDLTGIEAFTSLIDLSCAVNQLTSLDVSNNTALEVLNLDDNQLTSLDLSKNTALTYLTCWDNELTSLDVSNNTALYWLAPVKNQLTSLDVSKNTALIELNVHGNQLTSLDVSNNTALTELHCAHNLLTSLDVSANTALKRLNLDGNELTSLDVSSNTALIYLNIEASQLTTLDLSNNTALADLSCARNQLTTLDVSSNTALTFLSSYDNQITSLDVINTTMLSFLDIADNQLTSLDVSANTSLTGLYCGNNQLTSLNMRNGVTDSLSTFFATGNSSLTCIETLDPTYATANWTSAKENIDAGVTFAYICGVDVDGVSSYNTNGIKAITFNVELPAHSLPDTDISLEFWKSGAENHECTDCSGRDTVSMRKISDKYFEATVGLDTTLVANGETGESQYWYHYVKTIPDYKIKENLERFKLETNPDGLRGLMHGWHKVSPLVNKDTVVAWNNIAPVNFDWVSSALDTINISKTNLTDTYELKWSESKDVDIDTIDYLISVSVGQFPAEMINETADTSMTITYQDIIDNWYPNLEILSRGTLKFSVSATDGIDTVNVTGDDRVLFVNRYEYLSTESEGIPTEFALHENYPNPFNPTTTLRFDLPNVSDITLTIYNMLGQKVRTFNMQSTPAGYHTITWNATNDFGEQVGAGVYLYQLQAKDFVKTRKMVLLK